MGNACYSCSWQICERFLSTDVVLIARSANADRTLVGTRATVCADWRTETEALRRAKGDFFLPSTGEVRICAFSNTHPNCVPFTLRTSSFLQDIRASGRR